MNVNYPVAPIWWACATECVNNLSISPDEAIDKIYQLPGDKRNIYELVAFIERAAGFQHNPRVRELYRLGRMKLEQTCHLTPANFTAAMCESVVKRQHDNAACGEPEEKRQRGRDVPEPRWKRVTQQDDEPQGRAKRSRGPDQMPKA